MAVALIGLGQMGSGMAANLLAAGKPSVVAAGAADDLDAAQPLFDAIGAGTHRVGNRAVMTAAAKLAFNAGIPAVMHDGAVPHRSHPTIGES